MVAVTLLWFAPVCKYLPQKATDSGISNTRGDKIYLIFIYPFGKYRWLDVFLWSVMLKAEPEYFCQINILSFGLQCDLFKLQPVYSNCDIKVLQTE